MLAADSLQTWDEKGPTSTAEHPKIVIHSALPMAVAASGIAFVNVGTFRDPTTTYVAHAMEKLVDARTLNLAVAQSLLTSELQPILRAANAYTPDKAPPPDQRFDCFIVLWDGLAARVGHLGITALSAKMEMQRSPADPPFFSAVDTVIDFFKTGPGHRYRSDAELEGRQFLKEPKALGRHARALLEGAIRAEAKAYKDRRNHEIGGHVDVVIVDANGVTNVA